jgi:hypothetical protein
MQLALQTEQLLLQVREERGEAGLLALAEHDPQSGLPERLEARASTSRAAVWIRSPSRKRGCAGTCRAWG